MNKILLSEDTKIDMKEKYNIQVIIKIIILLFAGANLINILAVNSKADNNKIIKYEVTSAQRLQQIKDKGGLSVLLANEVPFCFIDTKTNQYTGLDVDIIKEAAKRLGIVNVNIKTNTFSKILPEMSINKELDVAGGGIIITDERKKRFLFTDPIYKESEAIVTPLFSKYFTKITFKDATIGVEDGSVFLDLVNKWLNEDIVKDKKVFNSQPEILQAINKKKVDIGMADSIPIAYILSIDKSLYLKMLPPNQYSPELPSKVGFVLHLDDVTLTKLLNEQINLMKQDRTILKILNKYGLNENYYIPYEPIKYG